MTLNNKDLVSIIITCFNLGIFLDDAINSVIAQTYTNWEIILVDDGSTDEYTINKVEYLKKENPRITVINQKNMGVAAARNNGIKQSKGKYIICLDADDKLTPTYIEETLKTFKTQPDNCAFVTTWLQEFGESFNIWKTTEFDPEKILVENLVHISSIFKKDVWEHVGGYKSEVDQGFEDWEFWINIVSNGFTWAVIEKPLFFYRIRNNSMYRLKKNKHSEMYKIIVEFHSKYFSKNIQNYADAVFTLISYLKEESFSKSLKINDLNSEITNLNKEINKLNKQKEENSSRDVNSKEVKNNEKDITLINYILMKFKNVTKAQLFRVYVFLKKLIPLSMKKILYKFSQKIFLLYLNKNNKENKNYIYVKNEEWDSKKPLASVVVPYYNRATTIDETINSLLRQTFREFEVILVDDGSNNKISSDYFNSLKLMYTQYKFINQKNMGVSAARNNGIKQSRGKYIICLDSDDYLDDTYIEKLVIFLEANPGLDFAYTDLKTFGCYSEIQEKADFNPFNLYENNMITTAAMFTKKAWSKVGGYKNNIGYEDWEFWITLTENGFMGGRLPETIFNYRVATESRFIEDKSRHDEILNQINSLHADYNQKAIDLTKEKNENVIKYKSSKEYFINLKNPSSYLKSEKQSVLLALPWMTFGGAETLIYNFASALKEKYDISFITGLKSKNEWEYKFKEISTKIYHLSNLFEEDDYLEFISNYILTRDIKILHIVHTGFMFNILEELKNRHPDLKIILTLFNDRVEHFKNSIKYEKYIDMFTSDNSNVSSHYNSLINDDKRITTIPNGLDAFNKFNSTLYNRDSIRKKLLLDKQDIGCLFVGRLSEEKNPDVFIEVAKEIIEQSNKNYQKLKFYIIGDGPMAEQVIKTVDSFNSERLVYLGYKSDVVNYLAATDVFILPSLIEGFPQSLLEAMSMGLVCIASEVGGIPEVLDNENGYKVTPGSKEEIKKYLCMIADSPDILKKVGHKARRDVEEKYTLDKLSDNYNLLYNNLLNI